MINSALLFLAMTQSINRVRWTTEDLKRLPDSSNRYEIIDGRLLMTRAPHWRHQKVITNVARVLNDWSDGSNLGEAVPTPGVIFEDADNVIPDVVWISYDRLSVGLDDEGHLTIAPELMVEVLSAGKQNQERDRETKVKLYSERGVQEYWILDWRAQQLEVYRREEGLLRLVNTLFAQDSLISPLLPEFICQIETLFK